MHYILGSDAIYFPTYIISQATAWFIDTCAWNNLLKRRVTDTPC